MQEDLFFPPPHLFISCALKEPTPASGRDREKTVIYYKTFALNGHGILCKEFSLARTPTREKHKAKRPNSFSRLHAIKDRDERKNKKPQRNPPPAKGNVTNRMRPSTPSSSGVTSKVAGMRGLLKQPPVGWG
ncbi:hypothetical protein EVAR_84350_1 [Eumeta japonica]|uniref:Uncharacterized protein n=1 Tax=Eumeta variegata TaxID=151549 RepID=A0A4C1U4A8_EUMVA|nr:hypothetical protein EVAR_84350_1 [Eumeta japonica]